VADLIAIRKEAARLEEDVLYSEKSHFSIGTVWTRVHYFLGIPACVLAALAGVSKTTPFAELVPILAIASSALTALLTFLAPDRVAAQHMTAGKAYSELRGRIRRFINVHAQPGGQNVATLAKQLEELAVSKTEIQRTSPHTGGLAYRMGKASVGRGEHAYKVDAPAGPDDV
jgi:hypothetical protein